MSVIRFFIFFAATDFGMEPPLLLKTRKSVKYYFKKFTADGANSVFIWFFRCLSPLIASVSCGSGRDEEQSGGGILRLIQIRFDNAGLRLTCLLDLSRRGY